MDFEFPDENGKAYKSNGGKFKYSKELKIEIPLEWSDKVKLQELCTIIRGKEASKK